MNGKNNEVTKPKKETTMRYASPARNEPQRPIPRPSKRQQKGTRKEIQARTKPDNTNRKNTNRNNAVTETRKKITNKMIWLKKGREERSDKNKKKLTITEYG